MDSHQARKRTRTSTGRPTPGPDWPRLVLAACRRLEQAADGTSVTAALTGIGASLPELRRQFRQRLGTTPKAYSLALRLMRLARGLGQEPDVLAAVFQAGFQSPTRAYALARRALGAPPGRLRQPACLGWWLGLSELGWMLMAATPAGICWLAFGASPRQLLAELAAAFPRASWVDDGPRLQAWFERVRAHILLPEAALALPVDIRGTAFQARVWQALQHIPLGDTRSYGALAQALGQPTAARAVATACAANRVAILIPCHRVIGADGTLTGYRWGQSRKRRLLDRERLAAAPQAAPPQMATSTAGSRRL